MMVKVVLYTCNCSISLLNAGLVNRNMQFTHRMFGTNILSANVVTGQSMPSTSTCCCVLV